MSHIPEIAYGIASEQPIEVMVVSSILSSGDETKQLPLVEISAIQTHPFNATITVMAIENQPRKGFKFLASAAAYCLFMHPDGYAFKVSNAYACKLLYINDLPSQELQMFFSKSGTFCGLITAEEAKTLPPPKVKSHVALHLLLTDRALEVGAFLTAIRSGEVIKYLGTLHSEDTLYHMFIQKNNNIYVYDPKTSTGHLIYDSGTVQSWRIKKFGIRGSAIEHVQELVRKLDPATKTEAEIFMARAVVFNTLVYKRDLHSRDAKKISVQNAITEGALDKELLMRIEKLSSWEGQVIFTTTNLYELNLKWAKKRWHIIPARNVRDAEARFIAVSKSAIATLPFQVELDRGSSQIVLRNTEELIDVLIALSKDNDTLLVWDSEPKRCALFFA